MNGYDLKYLTARKIYLYRLLQILLMHIYIYFHNIFLDNEKLTTILHHNPHDANILIILLFQLKNVTCNECKKHTSVYTLVQ